MILIFILGLVALRILYSVGEVYYERDWPRDTWKGLLIALGLLCIAVSAFGQAARVDIPLQTAGPSVPISGGPLPQALWVANAAAYLCTHPSATLVACQAAPITTYTDSTEGTTCPTATPLVQLPGNTCTASTGTAANVGFWYGGGVFDYWIVSSYGTYGPFSGNSSNSALPSSCGNPIGIPCGGTGATTAAGALTSLGAAALSGAAFTGPVSAPSVNLVVNAASFTGATADVKIAACTAAVVAAGGGVCDMRGFGAASTQSIAATINVPAGVTLLGDLATKFQITQALANSEAPVFTIAPNGRLNGVWVDMGNLTANTFVAPTFSFGPAYYTQGQITSLTNALVTATNQTGGEAVQFYTTSATLGIFFVQVSHVRSFGLNIGVELFSNGSGSINNNIFTDIEATPMNGYGMGFVFAAESTGEIASNQFIGCNVEQQNGGTNSAIVMEGTGSIQGNQLGVNIDDGIYPFLSSDAAATQNVIYGQIDGTITDDPAGANTFINPYHGTASYAWAANFSKSLSIGGAVTFSGGGLAHAIIFPDPNAGAVYTASQVLSTFYSPVAGTVPSGGAGTYNGVAATSYCNLSTAATASTTFTFADNGTSFGTVVFAASGTTGTFTISSAKAIASGDKITLTAPATADATAAGLNCSLVFAY